MLSLIFEFQLKTLIIMSFVVEANCTYEIVYNLAPFENLFLPDAFIAKLDDEGRLTYMERKANFQTITGYGFESNGVVEKLLSIIEQLDIEALGRRFNTNKRKNIPLEELLKDRKLRQKIVAFVDQQLDRFLTLIRHHGLPLCLGIERKAWLEDLRLQFGQKAPKPKLFFKKTADKVLYRLSFQDDSGTWKIRDREVDPITNQPAWLLIDYEIYQLPDINGSLVKPFRTKDEVPIPKPNVKDYFKKFILKIAEKVSIEAEGFEVIKHDKLVACELSASQHIFEEQWFISVRFAYPEAVFYYGDKDQQRTRLRFDENGHEVALLHIQRNPKMEGDWIRKLLDFDLVLKEGSFFELPERKETDYAFTMIEWLINNKSILEKAGFIVKPLLVDDHQLVFENPKLQLKASKENDWFDLHGVVNIGEFEISFPEIARYILDNQPFFPLPDGTTFLIPVSWFHKYREVAQIGQMKKGRLKLAKSQFTLLQNADNIQMDAAVMRIMEDKKEAIDYQPSPKLKATLRPYQLEGVRWLVGLNQKGLGACLADDMGLGKTLQTIAVLLFAKEQKENQPEEEGKLNGVQLDMFQEALDEQVNAPLNALIIMPASLIFNWQNELAKFAPHLLVYRHTGPKRHRDANLLKRFDVILTTYQTALRDVDLLGKIEYEYIVLDESQQIKNKNSKIFKAVNQLLANHKVSLSGTPIENALSDLWAQMQFINPNLLGNYTFFQRNFINPIERVGDEDVTNQLRSLINPYLLRRTKEMVAKDLPELTTNVFYSEMSNEQKKLYEREKSAVRNYLFENYHPTDIQYNNIVIKALTKLRQLANHPKLTLNEYKKRSGKFDDIMEHLDVIVRGNHKVLMFSSFVSHLRLFETKLLEDDVKYAWLTGETSPPKREKAIVAFENDPDIRVFLISLKAGGAGLNLTAADYVFIIDPWWNPAAEHQAIARAHRIGQTKNVFATKFITKDSIEEKILRLQAKKNKLVQDIIEAGNRISFTRQELNYLLE